MIVLRIILAPLLLIRWIGDPDWSFRHGSDFADRRPVAWPRHRYMPAGRRLGDDSVLRRRKLGLMAGMWLTGAALLMVALGANGIHDVWQVLVVGAMIACFLALGLSAAHKLGLARRSRHLTLVVDRDRVTRGVPFEVSLSLSPRAQGADGVEVGLVRRQEWIRWEYWRASLCLISDRLVWERWEAVPAGRGPDRRMTLEVPPAEPVSHEGDGSTYWLVSARAPRRHWRRRRTDIPIWVERR